MVNSKSYQYEDSITFDTVREAFKLQGKYHNPLLSPVNVIEEVLRKVGYISSFEHLGVYDTRTESFPIIVFNDLLMKHYKSRDQKPTKLNRFRFWLVKKILPK